MKRVIAGVCLVSLSACSASGMTMGLGAGVTAVGGAILASEQDGPGCSREERATTGCLNQASADLSNGIGTVAGLTLIGFGVLMMGLGAWGMAADNTPQSDDGLKLVPPQPAPLATAAPGATAPAGMTSEDPQQQKLAAHIQLAAHANRCEAAVYLLNRLRQLDEGRALSLVRNDEEVARCTLAKQVSLHSPG